MSKRVARQLLTEKAIVREAPALRLPTTVDRSFELPTLVYVAMAVLFCSAVGVMAVGFAAPSLLVPTGIFAVFLAMFFAVPAQWVRLKPENSQRAMSWSRFHHSGIMTPYGRVSASAALVQVLIMPALLLLWALAVVTIAAVAR